VHGLPEKVPVPEVEKLTVPSGYDWVPESVSVTIAVQVVDVLIDLLAGVHDVDTRVDRLLTPRALPVLSLLSAWIESLAV
jgi:hypothetical protein